MTWCAAGLFCLRVSNTSRRAIPVATGSRTHFPADLTPGNGPKTHIDCYAINQGEREIKAAGLPACLMMSSSRELVIWAISEEPAAFGWAAAMSPDRPTPCANLKTRDTVAGRVIFILW